MANALRKISREAKSIQKQHPRLSWQECIDKASVRYNRGTIGKKKAGAAKKKTAKPRKHSRKSKRKTHAKTAKHRPRKKRSVKVGQSVGAVHHKPRKKRRSSGKHKGRRIGAVQQRSNGGGNGISATTVLLLAGIAFGAWYLMKGSKPQTPQLPAGTPPLTITSNPTRNQQAANIVAYAQAGGMAIDSIIKLINALNQKSDSEVSSIYNGMSNESGVPGYLLI